METPTHTLCLGLGSNLGDRAAYLTQALAAFAPAIQITVVSPLYETEPELVVNQPRFLNLAACGTTTLSPQETVRHLKQIEKNLGRTPGERYGPRVIDIDLLLYDDVRLESDELTLPHPRMHERAFVLVPLADIAPHLTHPVLGVIIAELARRLGDYSRNIKKTAIAP